MENLIITVGEYAANGGDAWSAGKSLAKKIEFDINTAGNLPQLAK